MWFKAPDESIWIGMVRLSVRIPGSRSLKDKRRVVNQMRDRLKKRHGFSVAEVGHLQDKSRAIMTVVMVSNDAKNIQSALDSATFQLEQWSEAIIENRSMEIFRPVEDKDDTLDFF